MTHEDLPTYVELILPVIRAVDELGGSAKSAEIVDQVIADLDPSEELLAVTYVDRPLQSVYSDRIMWARSYAKLVGSLESPRRGVYLMTPLGRELLALPETEARDRVVELDRAYRRSRPRAKRPAIAVSDQDQPSGTAESLTDEELADEVIAPAAAGTKFWKEALLERLHQLSPGAFEEFVLYLLRLYGMELRRVGGPGDGGIDGIGTAAVSPVLSSRVAVQVKRYDPDGKPVSRDAVALLQRDASAKGAERAVFVTLGRFSEKAREAAIAMTPTVDLIDGERLSELVREQGLGLKIVPVVIPSWFDRFE